MPRTGAECAAVSAMASTVHVLAGVDDAVVPQPPRRVLRGRLLLNLVLGGLTQLFVGRLVERPARGLGRVAPDDREDARQLPGSHHGDAVVGPREDEAGVVGPARHGVVPGPVTGADHEGHMRHRRVRDGVDELGAVLDDPALLVARAHHESGDVLHEEDRRVDPVAQLDELGALLGLG